VYDYIGKNGEKILPGYRYITIYKDLYTVYGGSIDWIYSVLGIYTFSNELDLDPFENLAEILGPRPEEGEENEDIARMRRYQQMLNEMTYHDLVLMGEQYTEWKPYKHPLYGEIEIGGVKKFGERVPPLFRLAETCHRNAAFCLYHADQLPRLAFDQVEVTNLGGGLFQVDVAVENTRVTPTISFLARQKKLHRADRLRVEGRGIKLLAAGRLTDKFRGLTEKIETRKNAFWVESGIPGFGRTTFRLIVQGKGTVTLVYDSLKGGTCTTKSELK
ncbi:MAG: peptidase M14, partial [Candidatus Aminicenantales bacterium]